MAAQKDQFDQEAFNRKVGWATIKNYWLAIAAFFVLASLAVLQLPWTQRWIDADHPSLRAFYSDAKTWLATPWSLPWIAWAVIIAAAYGLGVITVVVVSSERGRELLLRALEPLVQSFNPTWRNVRDEPPTVPLSREEADEAAVASLAVPIPQPPEPEHMEIEQVVALRHMARRVRNVLSIQIASAVKAPEVTIIAALQQLQAWGLVTSGMVYWSLTREGIAYVNKHRAIFIDGKRP